MVRNTLPPQKTVAIFATVCILLYYIFTKAIQSKAMKFFNYNSIISLFTNTRLPFAIKLFRAQVKNIFNRNVPQLYNIFFTNTVKHILLHKFTLNWRCYYSDAMVLMWCR